MMQLEHFTKADIDEAAYLTQLTWGDEMQLADGRLKKLLYEAMVRYYFRSEALSFKMTDAEGMQGFLLAARFNDCYTHIDWLAERQKGLNTGQKQLVDGYLSYLHYNGEQVQRRAAANDVLLCLFLSRKNGVGSSLLRNVEQAAREKGAPQLHLWADATCDYEYYRRRGFLAAGTFTNSVLPQLGAQETWIYSKKM